MPRKGQAPKREIGADPKYHDRLVAKFINKLMVDGKKSVAERVVYGALNRIQETGKEDAVKIFKEALDQLKPTMEVRSRRVGGATYQVPMDVRPDRRVSLGLRWLIMAARERGGKSMEEKLAGEILDARGRKGAAFKKRDEVHRMAEANRAFAHFRW